MATTGAPRTGLVQTVLRQAAQRRYFLAVSGALACAGTFFAAYPVTAVVVLATIIKPRRWRITALATALGSALGATALMLLCHYWGWTWVYEHYPQFASHPTWRTIIGWVSAHGMAALFAVALSPLPQTPALVFLGIVKPETVTIFVVILTAKALKYGAFAWVVSRFPGRFGGGLRGLFGRGGSTPYT